MFAMMGNILVFLMALSLVIGLLWLVFAVFWYGAFMLAASVVLGAVLLVVAQFDGWLALDGCVAGIFVIGCILLLQYDERSWDRATAHKLELMRAGIDPAGQHKSWWKRAKNG